MTTMWCHSIPGLGQFVDCNWLRWHFGENYNIQAVGITPLTDAATPVYKRWHDEVLRMHGRPTARVRCHLDDDLIPLMVEWYPKVLVVSHLHPVSPQETGERGWSSITPRTSSTSSPRT